MKVLLRLLVVGVILGVLALGGAFFYLYTVNKSLPRITSLRDYDPPVVSSIYSRDGELLLELGDEKRVVAEFSDIPSKVVNCFLAAEDDSFYEHSGIDFMGVFRSLIKNILAGRVVQGGSTITQQVAKTFFTSGERTISRKIKDMLLAKKIEDNLNKEEILFLYLNQMYFGGGYYGIKMAAKGYYNKELQDLTIAEGALLAGLLARPHGYSPYVNSLYSKKRQGYVLKRLYETKKITEDEYKEALNEELKIYAKKDSLRKAGYFVDWVKREIYKKIPEEEFSTGGYEVITSLDWEYQKKAEESVLKGLKKIDKRQGYKGPLGTISNLEEQEAFFHTQRENYFKDIETYSTLKPDGHLEQELKVNTLEEAESEFIKLLKTGKDIKALVEKVDDGKQEIIARVSDNIRVKIGIEGFKWAKKRKVFHKPLYIPLITKPSQILKKDNVILVSLDKNISTENNKIFLGSLEQEPEVQGAFIALEPDTGEIIAMVGGRDYDESQFNRVVQAKRQPGSAFKSFYYAAALEKGYTPASIVMDTPYALSGVTRDLSWKPQNYDKKFLGPITFRMALEQSRNIPAIKVAQDVGVRKLREFMDRIGVKLRLPNDLSFSLGAFEIRLMDLVKGYSVFANLGKKVPLRPILLVKNMNVEEKEFGDPDADHEKSVEEDHFEDSYIPLEVDDDLLVGDFEFYDTSETDFEKIAEFYKKQLSSEQVYDERLAYIMTNILKGVIQSGTGRSAKDVGPFVSGKTGTTNDYVDAWFVGFSPDIVAGVWTGFDSYRTMGYGEGGGVAALPIWEDFMKFAIKKKGQSDFKAPPGVIRVKINKQTGKLSQFGDRNFFTETFVQGTEPSYEDMNSFNDGGFGFNSSSGGDSDVRRGSSEADDDFFLNQ